MSTSAERKGWGLLLGNRVDALQYPRFLLEESYASYQERLYRPSKLSGDDTFVYDWEVKDEANPSGVLLLYEHYHIHPDTAVVPDYASHAIDLIPQKFVFTLRLGGAFKSVAFIEILDNPTGKWGGDRIIKLSGSDGKKFVTHKLVWNKGGQLDVNHEDEPYISSGIYVMLKVVQEAYLVGNPCVFVDPVSVGERPSRVSRVGKYPLVKYTEVLLAKKLERRRSLGGTHASPRWHMRRGHWRTYKSGKKVWVEQMGVGDKSKGIIVKDYVVKP